MKQRIRQIINDMRRQPLISGVSFIATVMSVFLFMVVAILQRLQTIPFAPESCRDRLLVGEFFHYKSIDGSGGESSGGMSYSLARQIYGGLDGVESEAFMQPDLTTKNVGGQVEKNFQAYCRGVDAGFFKVFDHPLVSGRYFTADEVNAGLPLIVISERTARRAFGTTDCAGKPLLLNHRKYTVSGVVKDNSFLATTACGDVFIATGPAASASNDDVYFGNTAAALVVKDGVSFSSIREQVKARYAVLDTELKPQGFKSVNHGSPYDQATIASGLGGSNMTPDDSSQTMYYILYAILLVVPALNLSSLLHSRMHKRISEIGVRRAFGCTRRRVVTDILWENFLVTLAGGFVGVTAGIVFAMTYSGLYENIDTYGSGLTPALDSVINWGTIAIAVGVCFILNLISASVPAWQASRLNPVEAINAK